MPDPLHSFAPQVIVAGAGPVGLVAALTLAQAGIRVMLLEKRAGLSTASLASTIHPPTLELLDTLGVLSAVLPLGQLVDTIQYRAPDGILAEFPMAALSGETPFAYRLHLEQARITPVMLDRLRAMPNALVAFDQEVVAVTPGDRSVLVGLRGGAQVAAPFLLAADGAHSVVRDALGIAFDGADYPDKVLRVMTLDDLDALLPGIAPLTYLFNGARSASFLRMAECWRIILRVPGDVPEAAAMEETWILDRLRAVLPGCERLPTVAAKDVYGASRRVAARFAHGRATLLGDAAHVTNTRGGMNMNCGIHDAAHLAQAVVAALAADDPDLVAAAAAQRHRVATQMLIPRTDRAVSGGPAWIETLRQKAQDPAAAAAYLRTAAMLDMVGAGAADA